MPKITKPVDGNQAGISNQYTGKTDYNTNQILTKVQGEFNPNLLPMPVVVLDYLDKKPGKANRGGYLILRCPFHDDTKPSLNLHQVTGHFLCHACGAKSSNILSYYMKVTGKKFVEAAKALGAWEVKS